MPGILHRADKDILELSARFGGSFASTTALKALPAASRADGMVCNVGTAFWEFNASSSAGASGTVLVPDAGTGRWLATTAFDSTLADLLASTANGNGAALVGIEDSAGQIAATTVEGALAELAKFKKQAASAKGTNLTDADATITIAQGGWRVLPAATLTANRTITLGTSGAAAGDQITITRLDLTDKTFAIANGGVGAGTLWTMPASPGAGYYITAQFDGTNWAMRQLGGG